MLQATMDLWALPFGVTCCNEAIRTSEIMSFVNVARNKKIGHGGCVYKNK